MEAELHVGNSAHDTGIHGLTLRSRKNTRQRRCTWWCDVRDPRIHLSMLNKKHVSHLSGFQLTRELPKLVT